ncbi:uncharacterized protein LOC131881788 [Tigriopus californicus]|uniref:uncharacterized protein LOC131881788 n=1 Tax=Tigriopus californicus TaxID=6832 RepID=UPI0027DA61B0|nr:uncharacterized protein LOC131881788 [Tigriopus californicus]
MVSALKILMSFLVLCSAEGLNQKRKTTFPFQVVYNDDPNYKDHSLYSPTFNTDYVPNHKRNNETHTEIIFVNHHQAAPLPDSFPDLSHFVYEYDYPWEDIKDDFDANENYIEQEISTRPPTVPQNIQESFFKDFDEPVHFAPIQKICEHSSANAQPTCFGYATSPT